ncbi:hypothetical protein V8E54_005340 [Elaphomyces granulatus]
MPGRESKRKRHDVPPTLYPTPSETSEDTTIDALLAAPVQPQDDKTTVKLATDALKIALETEPLSMIREGKGLYIANKRAEKYIDARQLYQRLASEVELLKEEVSNLHHRDELLKEEVSNLHHRDGAQQLEISSLTTTISHLKEQNAKQRLIRNRFLAFFKRDIGEDLSNDDNRIIRDGNALAHDGDVWSDSLLYSPPNPRPDISVFMRLYGLDPAIISRIQYTPTTALMNLYGTLMSSLCHRGHKFPQDMTASYSKFLQALMGSDYKSNFLDDPNSLLSRAYYGSLKDLQTLQNKI